MSAIDDLAAFRKAQQDWRGQLIVSAKKEPKPLLANILTALRRAPEFSGVLAYDEFALVAKLMRAPPWEDDDDEWKPRAWCERDDALFIEWLQREGIPITKFFDAAAAVQAVAMENGFHPIRAYLNELEWDGIPRIGEWLHAYLGAANTPLNAAFGTCTLVGAVARVMEPGCKQDHMLVLEGPQGIGKSRAMKALGGQWFTDDLASMGTKDAAMGVRTAWIIEISELDAMRGPEIEKTKAFITRTTDNFRPPYGKRNIEQPRQSIFVGTTNATEYLHDATGGRRFWPITVTKIDVDALVRDRDLLFAEARDYYKAGEQWWMTDKDLLRQAGEEQETRYDEDLWTERVAAHLNVTLKETVSLSEILSDALNVDVAHQTKKEQWRLGRIMPKAAPGWERFRDAAQPDADGKTHRPWRYRPIGT